MSLAHYTARVKHPEDSTDSDWTRASGGERVICLGRAQSIES